jgi:hypothetical protein
VSKLGCAKAAAWGYNGVEKLCLATNAQLPLMCCVRCAVCVQKLCLAPDAQLPLMCCVIELGAFSKLIYSVVLDTASQDIQHIVTSEAFLQIAPYSTRFLL